jgi:hypothetical protein
MIHRQAAGGKDRDVSPVRKPLKQGSLQAPRECDPIVDGADSYVISVCRANSHKKRAHFSLGKSDLTMALSTVNRNQDRII